MNDGVVITGLGIVSPIGCGERAFWDALCQGRSAAAPVEGFHTDDLPRQTACQVREPIEVAAPMGRASKLAVTAARQAVRSASLTPGQVETGRVSVIMGTTMGETEFIEERLDAPESDWLCLPHLQSILRGRPGSISSHVRQDFDEWNRSPVDPSGEHRARTTLSSQAGRDERSASPLRAWGAGRGPEADLYGACAAGNMALALARRQLLDGQCDVALAGGADGFSRLAFIGFMRLRVMAATVCRPFDQQRDGLLVGEGAVVFVLERERSARARGASIRARISGTGLTCENYHPTRPHPDGDGLTRATRKALDDAGLQPGDIGYVCAHGTGTPQNDSIEVAVMEKCFPDGVRFSSIKALTGHTMGAAAAMEAACCVLSLENQTLIPTWNLEHVLEPCSLDPVQGKTRSQRMAHALNNSAGFGGYNASVVISAT